eukprot:CAMPEP_0117754294 /NCGR_PEP_ID=MMETSP0947-20121206/12746_1 /TAXON_ID=44440 /ORGANISM="Chattonella subsalsa, Strain CCMP2191" /LENGTH=420 /DNA_ID=CAMNT_0005573361 /DNA_START=149 /DNA_END=1408 /DNA_ORIENTATION=-
MARTLEPRRVLVQETEVTHPTSDPSIIPQSNHEDEDEQSTSAVMGFRRGKDRKPMENQDKFSFQAMNKEIELCVEETRIVYSENDQYGRKEYIGPVVNGKRHGEGTLVYRNNDRCEAVFEAGSLVEPTRFVKHDPDRRPKPHKRAKIIRVWYNDCPDGCQEYIGPMLNGKRQGHGLLRYHRDGLMGRFEGSFNKDQLVFGTVHWEDGTTYTGEFKDFLPCGNGQKTYPDMSTYVGQWWNGLRNGHGKVVYPNQDTLECTFVSDLPMGQGVYTWGAPKSQQSSASAGAIIGTRQLSATFTEFGTPSECTTTATVFWWVGALTSVAVFLFLNVWHGAPCNSGPYHSTGENTVMLGRGDQSQHRCVALGFDGGWTLHITHWWLYYNASLGTADIGEKVIHMFVTGVPLLMDLFVGVVFIMDLW